jgi:hypothetical protein
MKEHSHGIDALEQLPFTDIAKPYDAALIDLTNKARRAYIENLKQIVEEASPGNDDGEYFLGRLKNEIVSGGTIITPGGFSFNDEELRWIYEDMGTGSYTGIIEYFYDEVFPETYRRYDQSGRNPGNICLGYLLDLTETVNTQIASFDDTVLSTLHVLRVSQSPDSEVKMLGAMVDDALHLRGSRDIPFEFFIGRPEVERFRDSVLRQATAYEKQEFQKGIDFQPLDILKRQIGFSGN